MREEPRNEVRERVRVSAKGIGGRGEEEAKAEEEDGIRLSVEARGALGAIGGRGGIG